MCVWATYSLQFTYSICKAEGWLFYPDDGDSMFLRNTGTYLLNNTAQKTVIFNFCLLTLTRPFHTSNNSSLQDNQFLYFLFHLQLQSCCKYSVYNRSFNMSKTIPSLQLYLLQVHVSFQFPCDCHLNSCLSYNSFSKCQFHNLYFIFILLSNFLSIKHQFSFHTETSQCIISALTWLSSIFK